MDGEINRIARAYASEVFEEEVELLRTLARIPAPSRNEGRRADFVFRWLQEAGAPEGSLERDEAGNVLLRLANATRPKDDTCDLVVYAAHMDVVFPDTHPLPCREEDGRLYAPGVGDDTANLTGLLFAARWLLQHPERLESLGYGILVVANTCEEGLGNLDGTREVFRRYGSRIREFVTFDLHAPTVANEAVGSHRWRLSATGPGGHSYFDSGKPNAIEIMLRLLERVMALPLAEGVTCNVGRIEGGTTVNSIPEHCEALYEYRTTSDGRLREMRARLETAFDAFRDSLSGIEGVDVALDFLGERPGMGKVDMLAQEALVRRCADVVQATCHENARLTSASTDANIPLSLGIPACCVGTIRGDGMHTRGEWVELQSLTSGLVAILQIMLEA